MTALDTRAPRMWEELEASRMKRERAMFAYDEMIARYHGYYYSESAKGRTKEPANPGFEMLATMQAHLLSGTPQWQVQSARSDQPDGEMRAIGLQYSANRLSHEMRLKSTMRKLLVDWFFHGAYAVVQNKRYLWADQGPVDGPLMRPSITRVSPKLVREDPRCMDWDDTKWRATGAIASIKAILEDAKQNPEAGWRIDELLALQPDSEEIRRLVAKDGEGLDRDDIILWSVWIPDEQLDDSPGPAQGFYGTNHYYAQTGSKKRSNSRAPLIEVREPQAAYTGRHGPIQRFGQYYVPDRVEPLSVMIAIEHIARSMSMREAVIENAIKNYKRVLINGTGDKSLGAKLLAMPHMHMLYAKGFDKSKMEEYIIGGPDATMMAMREFDEDRLQKRSGVGMASMGRARPDVTATADTLAAGGQQARQDDLRDMFYDDLTELGQTFMEVIDTESRFSIPIAPEARRAMRKRFPQIPESAFPYAIQGGREEGQTLDDYEIKAAPMSMRYKSEIEVRAESDADIQMWIELGPASIANPQLDWPGIIQDRADVTGNYKLPTRFNRAVAEQMATLMLLQGAQIEGLYTPGQGRQRPQGNQQQPVTASVGGASKPGADKGAAGGASRSAMPGQKAGAVAGGGAKKIAGIGARK